MESGTVFALDIGTRVVVGLMMHKDERGYEILAGARTEHTERSMYDGQVHDVDQVAAAVLRIKNELEMKTGLKLKKVAVAAAGRALCTEFVSISREETTSVFWEQEEVLALEMEAVRKAMLKINKEDSGGNHFYCVGYSTIKCFLENQEISSLVGQRGKKAEISVIATFLPRTVVDGLVSVLARTGLEMANLTLEPIAAGQAAIPANMRKLNLALVDIGAGTADIALTRDGSFFSYGMVPLAGDEVTETICSNYLLDFSEGERVKRELNSKEEIGFTNFFGEKITAASREILEMITPAVQTIAERISEEVNLLNQGKPQAVILVGGGSLTPLLADILASAIGLPRNRVGIQVRERLTKVSGMENDLTGADVITPIGIGMQSLDGKGLHYYSVTINNVNIPLLELQLASVAEALLAAGIHPKSFLGRPGTALVYEINGSMKIIKGELGNPARITVNDKPARLEQLLYPNDVVTFVAGCSGADGKAQIKDILPGGLSKRIYWNGREEILHATILLNNRAAGEAEWLEDASKIAVENHDTLFELLNKKGFSPSGIKKIGFKINGEVRETASGTRVLLNSRAVTNDCRLQERDRVEVIPNDIKIKDLELQAEPMAFQVNGEEFLLQPAGTRIFAKGKELAGDDLLEDGTELRVTGFVRKPILSELFPYLNLLENNVPGGRLQMIVNGQKAEFTTELNQGDRISIGWTK